MRHARDVLDERKRRASIHAPHARCDQKNDINRINQANFNPRTPCEVRHADAFAYWTMEHLQSTHSIRSATIVTATVINLLTTSIHAPHARCDERKFGLITQTCHFNPRTPCEVRLVYPCKISILTYFNPHTPYEARHRTFDEVLTDPMILQSTHLA